MFSLLKTTYTLIRTSRSAALGATILLLMIFLAVSAPWLSSYDPLVPMGSQRLLPPSWEHLMGTDQLGRDIFSRVLHGARSSIVVATGVMVLTTLAGVLVGVAAGFHPRLDSILIRVMDGIMAFPAIIIAIILAAVRSDCAVFLVISILR